MWKRLQGNKGNEPADIQVGPPTLLGHTLDQNEFGYKPETLIDVGQSSRSQIAPRNGQQPRQPYRQPRQNMPTPINTSGTYIEQQARNRNALKKRPASSLYSQPSPAIPDTRFIPSTGTTRVYDPHELEISPPSSPDLPALGARKSKYQELAESPDVSPIDEMPSMTDLSTGQSAQSTSRSSIPVLRRENRRKQVAAAANRLLSKKETGHERELRQSSNPRWDPLTGEPTTESYGKPSQIKPAEFSMSTVGNPSTSPGYGTKTTISANKPQASFGERIRRMADNSIGPSDRPEWKGASGRQKTVPPIAEDFNIPPLNIPRRSSKRGNSPKSPLSGATTPVSVIVESQVGVSGVSSLQPSQESYKVPKEAPSISNGSSPNTAASPASIVSPIFTASDEYNDIDVERKSSAQGNYTATSIAKDSASHKQETILAQAAKSLSPSTSQIGRNFDAAMQEINISPEVSRFSVSTYAPSPDSTPRPSIERSPFISNTAQMQSSSVIERRRPRNEVKDSPKATIRKPMLNPSIRSSIGSTMKSRDGARLSLSKTLPKSPPETESENKGLIVSLQARIDNLMRRRLNLEKSIFQMTELMPQDGVSGRERERRDEEKRKVEGLRAELDDVKKEEHELGLKLHRAWKREADGEVWESTSLWVRRVTD